MIGVSEQPREEIAVDRGQAMHALVARLYPYCRSLTGDGVRQTCGFENHPLVRNRPELARRKTAVHQNTGSRGQSLHTSSSLYS